MTTATTPSPDLAPDTVDATTLRAWVEDPDAVTVIDVRTPAEFETVHIAGSSNIPLDLLGEHAAQLASRLDRDVVLVCQSGARAAQARQRLAGVGAKDLHVLDGGVPGFAAVGGDVVRGQARWAMDRQVRLAAGSLVLASILASLRLPGARFLAGGIGAGLSISALTNTCTMSRALALLPYNRGPARPSIEQALEQLPDQHS